MYFCVSKASWDFILPLRGISPLLLTWLVFLPTLVALWLEQSWPQRLWSRWLVCLCCNRRESECSVPQRKYTAHFMLTLLLWLAYFDHLIFSLILMYSKVWTLSLSCNLILLSCKCSEGQWIFSSTATWTAGALEIVVATAASVVTVLS